MLTRFFESLEGVCGRHLKSVESGRQASVSPGLKLILKQNLLVMVFVINF